MLQKGMSQARFEHSIQKLTDWCASNSTKVEFSSSKDSLYCEWNSTITINTHRTLESQLYILLHECGHVLQKLHPNPLRQNERGWARVSSLEQSKTLPKLDKMFLIIDEIDAWERGLKLANKLAIEIDMKKFDLNRSLALHAYFRWAGE